MKRPVPIAPITILSSALLLSACGGGGGGGSPGFPPTVNAGSIQFATTAATVTEVAGGSTVDFSVTRTGGTEGAVSITIDRTGTAAAGADYTIASTTVTFAAGDAAAKTVRVTVADDLEIEAAESLTLTLTAPTGGATIGANAAATLTINDNDGGKPPPPPPPPQGSIQFERTALDVQETAGGTTAIFNVLRTGGSEGAVSATVSGAGTATEDADYRIADTTVSFAAGDAAAKTVRVNIADNNEVEADETLTLTLSAPTGGATIGTNAAAVLTIKDNDVLLAPTLNAVETADIKQLKFTWLRVQGATGYRLMEKADAAAQFETIAIVDGADNTSFTFDAAVHGTDWANPTYAVVACVEQNCSAPSNLVGIAEAMLSAIGYFKASNTDLTDQFGLAVALSADGSTLAVGAIAEDSDSRGVDNAETNATDPAKGSNSGAVYVFVHDAQGRWTKQGYLKPSNTDQDDHFGSSLALSANGSTLAVGAKDEDNNAGGVNSHNQGDSALGTDSGAAYVFTRDESGKWDQQAYVKALHPSVGDLFGSALALSADGSTLAVGALNEDGGGIGIGDHDQQDESAEDTGAVFVFTHDDAGQWTQQQYIKASNPTDKDRFGSSVALSEDGSTLAVGAINEDSAAQVVDGDQGDSTTAENFGAVYVFTRDDADKWSQQEYIKPSNAGADDSFGWSVALSANGNTLAVGAPFEDSGDTGAGADDQGDTATGHDSGAAYVFTRDDAGDWQQQEYVKAFNTGQDDVFGSAVALSADGDTLAVGAPNEDSTSKGIDGSDGDDVNGNIDFGAVYVYARDDTGQWSRQSYVKASNAGPTDTFGFAVALGGDGTADGDGTTLAVSAPGEFSASRGISHDPVDQNGDNQNNDDAPFAGAVYLY